MNSQNEQDFAKRERKRTEIEARLSASNIGSAERILLENQLRGINRLQTQLLERAIDLSDGPQREVFAMRLEAIEARQRRSKPATASTGAPVRNTPSRLSPTGTVEFDDSPPVSGVRSPLQTGARREPEQTPRPATRRDFDTARRNLVERVGHTPVGEQRTDTASADAVISDRETAGTDWNTQFEQTRAAVATSQGEVLAGIQQGVDATGESISQSERNVRGAIGEALRQTSEGFDAIIGQLGEQGDLTRDTLRNIDESTRAAIAEGSNTVSEEARRTRDAIREEAMGTRAEIAQMNAQGSRERATIINELQLQSGDLGAVVNTLGRIEAQGRALPPDALQEATLAIEQEPEIQRLVNNGLLKWQDLLDANGELDMAAVGRVRMMLRKQQVLKENEVQSAYAMFNRIETQPGRKSLGAGQSLWFPAMWSNTIRS